MARRCDISRKFRRSHAVENDQHFPAVSFDGAQSVDIPADDDKSPVSSHYSLASNPAEFKFMDEIALLKRGRIDKDAPKHPYNRRWQPAPATAMSTKSNATNKSATAKSPAIMTLMGGVPEEENVYVLGPEGQLKVSRIKEGGQRYEVSSKNHFTVFQQTAGQTCLFTFKE